MDAKQAKTIADEFNIKQIETIYHEIIRLVEIAASNGLYTIEITTYINNLNNYVKDGIINKLLKRNFDVVEFQDRTEVTVTYTLKWLKVNV